MPGMWFAVVLLTVTGSLLLWVWSDQRKFRASSLSLLGRSRVVWRRPLNIEAPVRLGCWAGTRIRGIECRETEDHELILACRGGLLKNPVPVVFRIVPSRQGTIVCHVLMPRSIVVFTVWWTLLDVLFAVVWLGYGGDIGGIIACGLLVLGLVLGVFALVQIQYSAILATLREPGAPKRRADRGR